MTPITCMIDDKHVPLFRILWISDVPHFCGHEDCTVEGRYEVRLEADETVFCNRPDRDKILSALESWATGTDEEETWN